MSGLGDVGSLGELIGSNNCGPTVTEPCVADRNAAESGIGIVNAAGVRPV